MYNRSHRQSIISFSFIGYYLITASVTSCIVNSNLRFRFNSRWLCKHNGEPKFAIVICMLWFYSKSKSPSSFFSVLVSSDASFPLLYCHACQLTHSSRLFCLIAQPPYVHLGALMVLYVFSLHMV